MENSWNDDISEERKDLTPIMEEEDKGQMKGLILFFVRSTSSAYRVKQYIISEYNFDKFLILKKYMIKKNICILLYFQLNY